MFYADKSISGKKLKTFLEKCTASDFSEIHALKIYKKNKLILEFEIPPYKKDYPSQVYSLSKSFTSTAIGLLFDDGKLKLDDIAADVLEWNGKRNDRINKMTISHLLSMNTGHELCVMPKIVNTNDGVNAFFEQPIQYDPGTHFAYNTAATYVLSAIVTKLTGLTLLDFLNQRLFKPLGMNISKWHTTAENKICEGGIGLFVSVDDIAKLGLLYYNKGMHNGQRILSEEWIELATSKQSDNPGNGTPDWTSGYGYQIWKNAKGGYRFDGAYGQYCVVLPEQDLVCATISETSNMGSQINYIIDFLLDYEGEDATDIDVDNIYKPEKNDNKIAFTSGTYKLDDNKQGFTICDVTLDKTLVLKLSNGKTIQKIEMGNGEWIFNTIEAPAFKPTLTHLSPYLRTETAEFYASYCIDETGKIIFDFRYVNCPHRIKGQIELNVNSFNFKITQMVGDNILYPDAQEINGKAIL